MMGATIMFRWDCGWTVGIIKRRHTRGTDYNYFVQYVGDGGTISQYRHGLRVSNYFSENSADGVWFVLVKRANHTER